MPERDHAMMQVSERLRDFLGFGVLLVLLAVLLVVPHEIPKEIQGDFPAEVYPRTLLVVGVVLLGLQVAITLARGRGAAQIGRASCRERVGQYVSFSVVAVFFKKKKTTSAH